MTIGFVKAIWRHPVKSMAGDKQASCFVGPFGISGDRGWALRDEATREVTNGKRFPLVGASAADGAIQEFLHSLCPSGVFSLNAYSGTSVDRSQQS